MNDVNSIAAEESLVRSWNFDEGGQAVEMGPAALPELPPDHELRSEYLKNCPDCGQEVRERTSISPKRILMMERSPCRCVPRPAETEQASKERVQRELNRHFGEFNLVNTPGPNLAEFEPRAGQEEALELARLFFDSRVTGKSFLLTGPSGRGKTEVALALARSARLLRTTVFINYIDLLDRIRRSLWQEDKRLELVGLLRTVDLLVIDDLGVEKAPEWVLATLYSIIDYRYGRRDTVFTTKSTGKEMARRLGVALTSRICGSRTVSLEGPDWRINGRQQVTTGWSPEKDKW